MNGKHFNALTPIEAELLALLSEECGELVQAIGKILRHGIFSYHPDTKENNIHALHKEMGDVRAAMILLCQHGVAVKEKVYEMADRKLAKVGKYLHHASSSDSAESTHG